MKTITLLMALLVGLNMRAQKHLDSTVVFEFAKGTLSHPVNGFTKLINYDSVKYRLSCPYPGNTYYLNNPDTVKAIFDGTIVSIINIGETYAIITKFGAYYICYSGLAKPLFRKGEYIEKNQPLGTLCEEGNYLYKLELLILKQLQIVDPMLWLR